MSWWSLNRNLTEVRTSQKAHTAQLAQLKKDLKAARDPAFLEREARERLNLVKENDLVFVFSEED